jgi:hypothetical protein
MSLVWKERLTNVSLRKQLSDDAFASGRGKMLGVYLKLPAIQLQVIEKWVASENFDEEHKGTIVAAYLDLVWLQELTAALTVLISNQHLPTSVERERQVVIAIAAAYPRSLTSPAGRIVTMGQLTSALGRLRETIERAAIAKVRVGELVMATDCFSGGIGSLGRNIARMLVPLLGENESDETWHIRVCMDEGESLSPFQLLVLNSMVRLTEWPVFFAVAFVRQPDEMSQTLLPNLSLQDADRKIVSLSDFLTEARFRRLAEGVAAARIERELGATPTDFALSNVFGAYDLNDLLASILKESVSSEAKELLLEAQMLAESPAWADQPTAAPLPVYQAYLIRKLGIVLPEPDTANWKRRKQSSAEIRKRMVAAYLSIFADLKVRPRYAGLDMLLGVSDGSIRDLLRFLDSTYRSSNRPLSEFVQTLVPVGVQDSALKEASEAKLRGIQSSGVTSISEIEKLVQALGIITAKVQTSSSSDGHLRSSERGIFSLKVGPGVMTAVSSILEAGEAGYLQLLSVTADEIVFRMHTSLAPAFGFSYRGAYYKSPLQWEDVETIRRAASTKEAQERAVAIGARLAGTSEPSLFD